MSDLFVTDPDPAGLKSLNSQLRNKEYLFAGIYIMQNTMVRGGDGQLGKKIKIKSQEEKIKGGREKGGNYIKKGEKGHKNAFFWAINSKKCRKLICRGKNLTLKEGGGE